MSAEDTDTRSHIYLGRMQTGLKKPRLYIHHLFGLMQFTVQYCFHVICMYVPKCNFRWHRQISGRFPMSHVDLGGLFREGGLRSHVDLGTIGLTGPRSQDDMGQNPRWYTALVPIPYRLILHFVCGYPSEIYPSLGF